MELSKAEMMLSGRFWLDFCLQSKESTNLRSSVKQRPVYISRFLQIFEVWESSFLVTRIDVHFDSSFKGVTGNWLIWSVGRAAAVLLTSDRTESTSFLPRKCVGKKSVLCALVQLAILFYGECFMLSGDLAVTWSLLSRDLYCQVISRITWSVLSRDLGVMWFLRCHVIPDVEWSGSLLLRICSCVGAPVDLSSIPDQCVCRRWLRWLICALLRLIQRPLSCDGRLYELRMHLNSLTFIAHRLHPTHHQGIS